MMRLTISIAALAGAAILSPLSAPVHGKPAQAKRHHRDDDDDDDRPAARAASHPGIGKADQSETSPPLTPQAGAGNSPDAAPPHQPSAGAPRPDGDASRAGVSPAIAQSPSRAKDDDDDDVRPSGASADIVVTARRLDTARASVEPSLGASTYSISNDTFENRPLGETTSIAQILLQAPGVAQAGGGQINVRGSPSGVQYRINNVILPDGVADLGERLSPRLADRVDLLTGALPAQYGLQVGGVVNITTKNGAFGRSGQIEATGGSHGQFEPAFEYTDASGSTSWFTSASYFRDTVGLGAPDGSRTPLHDHTHQFDGLAFVDHVIDPQSRLSLVIGTSDDANQIPEAPFEPERRFGADPAANPVNGGHARADNQFGSLSYLRTEGPATVQLSLFGRYSVNDLRPGASAGLSATGVGGSRHMRDWAGGVQAEGAYVLDPHHTLRAGGVVSTARLRNLLDLSVAAQGGMTVDHIAATSHAYRDEASLFLQDEWGLADQLTLNLGGRLDHVGGIAHATRVEPRANLVWAGSSGLTLHAGYARYLVAPALYPADQLRQLGGTSAAPNGLPDRLRVETDDYYDVGVEQKWKAVTLGLDLFQRDARAMLASSPVGAPLLARPFNYRSGRIRGVEVRFLYAQGPLSAWANLTYLHGRAEGVLSGGAYLPTGLIAYLQTHRVEPEGVQPYSASAGASYHQGRFHLSGTLLYGGGGQTSWQEDATAPRRLPTYAQADFALLYRLDGLRDRPLDVRLDLINAFDRRYRLSDDGEMGIPVWGPRRGLFVGLEQNF
jgi:outer membrane receptor for ferrienterochelin and colicin